jgi:hypothetical protein
MKHARKRGKGGGYGIYPYHVNRVTVAHMYTIPYFLILPGGYMWPKVKDPLKYENANMCY